MPFIRIEGFTGNIYVPETDHGRRKHQCSDCFSCQYCSDERCRLCLEKKCKKGDVESVEKKPGKQSG